MLVDIMKMTLEELQEDEELKPYLLDKELLFPKPMPMGLQLKVTRHGVLAFYAAKHLGRNDGKPE